MPPQICASVLPGKTGKHENCIFTQTLYQCIARIQLVAHSFLESFDSRLLLALQYDSLNRVINSFISGMLGAWFTINEVESAAEVGLCCTHNAPVRCLLSFLFHKVGKQSIV